MKAIIIIYQYFYLKYFINMKFDNLEMLIFWNKVISIYGSFECMRLSMYK